MGALARREGWRGAGGSGVRVGSGDVGPEGVGPAGWDPDGLSALAIHNAVEGCVRETSGALIARWQAHAAPDRRIRATMARIAREETRHAALAWQIDAWARGRLDRAARARVATARTDALAALLRSAARPVPETLVARLGLPTPAVATRLVRTVFGPRARVFARAGG